MIRADLHIHTVFSDGLFTPEEIARRVKEAGVSLFAVTDHDNMEGVERAEAAAKQEGLLFVRAMEVSSYDEGGRVHVLGYCCDRNAVYERFLKERAEGAYLRADDSRKKANAYLGLNLTMKDIEAKRSAPNTPIHTAHVVGAFASKLGKSWEEVYCSVFDRGMPAYSKLHRMLPEEAVTLIHELGGIAVLAHPAKIKAKNYKDIADALVRAGLDGIECYHSTHTESDSACFAAYAKEKNLLLTGGSDFHAEGKGRRLGVPEFYPSERLLKAFSLA